MGGVKSRIFKGGSSGGGGTVNANTMADPDDASCTLYKADGTEFTDDGTIRLCNVIGGIDKYVLIGGTWEIQGPI